MNLGAYNPEDFEDKYEHLMNDEKKSKIWMEIHDRRSQHDISDEEFKEKMLEMGIEHDDIQPYIDMLNFLTNTIHSISDESYMEIRTELMSKHENYLDIENIAMEHLKADNDDAAMNVVKEAFSLSDDEAMKLFMCLGFMIEQSRFSEGE
jgi:hypothetical protein